VYQINIWYHLFINDILVDKYCHEVSTLLVIRTFLLKLDW